MWTIHLRQGLVERQQYVNITSKTNMTSITNLPCFKWFINLKQTVTIVLSRIALFFILPNIIFLMEYISLPSVSRSVIVSECTTKSCQQLKLNKQYFNYSRYFYSPIQSIIDFNETIPADSVLTLSFFLSFITVILLFYKILVEFSFLGTSFASNTQNVKIVYIHSSTSFTSKINDNILTSFFTRIKGPTLKVWKVEFNSGFKSVP
jgi:hypothetical protein